MIAILLLLAQLQHAPHPPVLPAPDAVWNSCCHDQDCAEASLSVMRSGDGFIVSIADYAPFKVRADKVFKSENGKSYFCTVGGWLPPDPSNILCVFYIDPSMVKR